MVFKGDLEGDSKGDIRWYFKQDLVGDLLTGSMCRAHVR